RDGWVGGGGAGDTPAAGAEGAPAYQAEGQRNHRHDELRPPREDTEDEPAGGERHHRKSERRHAGRHPSAFGTGTCVRRSLTTWAADSFETHSSGCRIRR